MQVKLNKTLEKVKYITEVYITPSKYSNCYAKSFGASFYPNAPNYLSPLVLETYRPQIEVRDEKGLKSDDPENEWLKISVHLLLWE